MYRNMPNFLTITLILYLGILLKFYWSELI